MIATETQQLHSTPSRRFLHVFFITIVLSAWFWFVMLKITLFHAH
jgi:hypothetical protein